MIFGWALFGQQIQVIKAIMIKNKKDLLHYLEKDKKALKVRGGLKDIFFNEIWIFQKLLRKTEYYHNTGKKVRFSSIK